MLRKLYGLFIYKLQMTSYFSIMERVSGFLLLSVVYYFFVAEIFANSFFIKFSFEGLGLIIILLIIFFFSFHMVNGLRIYILSLYYYITLKKQPLTLETLYSFSILEKNKFFKLIINNIKSLFNYVKVIGIKSNYSFLLLIFLVYIFLIISVLI